MFSVGLKLEHCAVQVSLTMANQDSFFQRIKASQKPTGSLTKQLSPDNGLVIQLNSESETHGRCSP